MQDRALGHTEDLLHPVPHRQYSFSTPIILRRYFLYNRKLLGKLCLCAKKSLVDFFGQHLKFKDGIPSIVMTVQTFGDYARWHPHIHALVADGLFTRYATFHVMPRSMCGRWRRSSGYGF